MVEAIYLNFIGAWLLSLVAFILGRYVGRGSVKFPSSTKRWFLIYFQVWCFAFVAQLAFSFLGYALQWKEPAQTGFADFLLPIVVSGYFARQRLSLENQRETQKCGGTNV